MLYMLGALQFEVWPLNVTKTDNEHGSDYAEKPVMGRRPPIEFVGDASEHFTITAALFPAKLGGLWTLEALRAIRHSGIPQYLMRGDGVPLGWFVVTKIKEQSSYLAATGVGQKIDVDISLLRGDGPGDADYYSTVIGVLG